MEFGASSLIAAYALDTVGNIDIPYFAPYDRHFLCGSAKTAIMILQSVSPRESFLHRYL